jgi:hypothetical protein
MKNITVILPLHSVEGDYKEMLKNAITSVEDFHNDVIVSIVCPKSVEDQLNFPITDKVEIKFITNEGQTDFCSQVNLGIEKCETEWFSILEYDDEYSKIWFKNVEKYVEAYPDVDIFMPIIVDVDEYGQFIGFTNEAVWANSFSDEMGYLDKDALLSYQNFNIDGVVMKKESFQSNGGLKSNIKLTFTYEFLLRMSNKACTIMTIPKFGYKHVNQRVGSLFHNYKLNMNPVEANWWLNKAKTEFYHENDREISYTD